MERAVGQIDGVYRSGWGSKSVFVFVIHLVFTHCLDFA